MQRSIGAVRGFAKAAKVANHAPPIKIFGIPGKYAEATYTAASKVSAIWGSWRAHEEPPLVSGIEDIVHESFCVFLRSRVIYWS